MKVHDNIKNIMLDPG